MLDRVMSDLREVVGGDQLLVDPVVRAQHETDWTGRFTGSTRAVIRPSSAVEIAAVIGICRSNGVAVVPQGGNTGLVGGATPYDGALVMDLRRLKRLDPVDTAARQVTVGAGVPLAAVQRAARDASLRYAVDFGSRDSATIGGSIATNAGGINVLRYGATREQLVGVEAVLGTGQIVSRLQGLVKDNTGYHLAGLLCGSEGTLGVITAARLELVTHHDCIVTAMVGFKSVGDAVNAASVWRSSLDDLDAAELMLAEGIELVQRAFGHRSPFVQRWPASVLIEVAAHDDPTSRVAEAVSSVAGVGEVVVATDASSSQTLWRLREDHTLAISRVGVPRKFDVTVPVAGMDEFIEAVPGVVRSCEPQASTWIFGHVGDGNLHVNVTGAAGESDELDEQLYRFVVSQGGCISAEHGIGRAKARWLSLDRSESELDAMRAIKNAFDPGGVLNPGVLLAGEPSTTPTPHSSPTPKGRSSTWHGPLA